MPNRLIATLNTGAVASGASITLAHGINNNGAGLKPDYVERSNDNFEVTDTTTTTITVRNNGLAADSCDLWIERKHSIPRVLGGTPLTPAPFVPGSDGGGSANANGVPRFTPDAGSPVHMEIRYCRPGGSNDNDGLTPATAWADGWEGFKKGLDWYLPASYNLCQRLDITGCTIVVEEEIQIGGGNVGGSTYALDVNCTAPGTFCAYVPFQVVALPALSQALTVTVAAQDTNSKLWTITVAETMVVNAHRGKNLLSQGIFEWGTIKSNTANQLLVASSSNPSTWTGQVGAYTRSASITAGDPAVFGGGAVKLQAMASWYFVGINFQVTAGMAVNAVAATCLSATYFQFCEFDGFQLIGGSEEVFMDSSYLHDGESLTVDDGACLTIRESVVRAVVSSSHGTDHARFSWVWFDALVSPLGSGSLSISQFSFDVFSCAFDACPAGALIFLTGNCRLQNAKIENSPTAIQVINPSTRLEIINVGGSTGNTGIACTVSNGAQIDVGATVTVSGAGGERKIGGNAVGNWATLPETDVGAGAPQFCRAY